MGASAVTKEALSAAAEWLERLGERSVKKTQDAWSICATRAFISGGMAGYFSFIEGGAMKNVMKWGYLICLAALLGACTFGPNGICGPQTPAAYCDKGAYQRLARPKPYLENWTKLDVTPDERRRDSAMCGGGNSDSPGFSHRTKAFQLSGEKENETYTRLFHEWERCMLKKGYRYTGPCYDNEISKAKPACGAQ